MVSDDATQRANVGLSTSEKAAISGESTGEIPLAVAPSTPADQLLTKTEKLRKLGRFGASSIAIGLVCGIVWRLTAPLPTFTIAGDGSVVSTDRTVGDLFGSDAVFVVIGMIGGVLLGIAGWYWVKFADWAITIVALLGSSLAALIAWLFGMLIGPHGFAQRLSNAAPGAQISADLALRTPTAWLLWPVGAIIPILLYSALTRTEKDEENNGVERTGGEKSSDDSAHDARDIASSTRRLMRFPAFGHRENQAETGPTAARE